MPNSLAFGWVEHLVAGIDELDWEAMAQLEAVTTEQVASDGVSAGAEMPMSNIEVEWLPVESHVVIDA